MIEFFNECINAVNLPVTVIMIMVLLYWLMVIVGVLGLDTLDFDLDTDVGLDADVGVDTTAEGSFSGSSLTPNEGIFRALFEFFYLGEVPVVIIGTFFMLFLWIFTFITNHYFNTDQSILIMLLWLIPNIVVSAILTRYCMIPFAILFKPSGPDDTSRKEMVGLIGLVTTSEVTEKFGELEIPRHNDSELIVNVRTRPGEKLAKGDAAKIISFNNTDGTFLVELTKWENKVND